MTGRFRYAMFDDTGRCTGIMSCAVDMVLDHRVDDEARADDLCLRDGQIARRERVQLTASRSLLVCDGRDAVTISGLPEGAAISIDGKVDRSHRIIATQPRVIVVEAVGRWASERLIIEADTLDRFAQRLIANVDRGAEAALDALEPQHASRQAIYRAKEAEARAFLDVTRLTIGSPILTGEAAVRGVEPVDLAKQIIAKAATARALSAEIEAARIAAKEAIRAAGDLDTMIAAANVRWPQAREQGAEQ